MAWEEHRLDSHCDEAHHVILAHNPRSGSDLQSAASWCRLGNNSLSCRSYLCLTWVEVTLQSLGPELIGSLGLL